MAISQAMCSSFKSELLGGIHDLDTDTIQLALYTSVATIGPSTTVYTASGETSGSGYTAGGKAVTGLVITLSGTTAYLDFDNVTWSASTITARGALLYNASKANRAIAVYDFGSDVSTSAGDFVVQVPAPGPSTAVLRLT